MSLYPTCGGTGLVGIWKAIAELAELGWLANGNRPRMIAVQAAGCAPVVKAFDNGANSYIRKPVDYTQFVEFVRQLGTYWLILNKAPLG